jgi:hypothetical protein
MGGLAESLHPLDLPAVVGASGAGWVFGTFGLRTLVVVGLVMTAVMPVLDGIHRRHPFGLSCRRDRSGSGLRADHRAEHRNGDQFRNGGASKTERKDLGVKITTSWRRRRPQAGGPRPKPSPYIHPPSASSTTSGGSGQSSVSQTARSSSASRTVTCWFARIQAVQATTIRRLMAGKD